MVFFVRITVNQSHLRPICKSTKFNPKIQRTIYSINFQRLRLHVLDFIRTVVQKFIISHRIKITIEKMDQHILEKRAISSKKYTYLQYSLASALSKSSFFCITTIQDAIELYPDPWYEMHSHRFYSIFWFHSGEGTHIVDFDEYNIEKDSIFFLSPKHLHTFRHLKNINGICIIFTEDLLLHFIAVR